MKYLLFTCFLLSILNLFGQNSYFLKDSFTQESIPFAKVKPQGAAPLLADIDGVFSVGSEVLNVEIKTSGYRDTLVNLANCVDNIIFLQPTIQNVIEVIVTAGENPAHRIIDKAIANRKLNNPMENDAFQYESYSKFIFDINREEIDRVVAQKGDTTLSKIQGFLDQQYLFMLESASTRTFIPPARDKEEITAYKVSGFTDAMFSTFANEMQSFSFYENQVQLLGKNYINPIAFGGTNRYLFILQDTTVVGKDTTFTIFYRPRKGKNFEGMTGQLFINTNGYAIEKVIASPYSDTLTNKVKIVQEYAFSNGKKWFPSKLSTEIIMSSVNFSPKLKQTFLEGKGSTYIKNVSFDLDPESKKGFDNVSVTTSEEAGEVKDEIWDSLRIYTITEKENRTYNMIDSLSKANHLDRRVAALKILSEGKIPLGYFNLDISRLINFNLYEGYRFGGGLETSKKLMKPVVIGGYLAWANRDKVWKYGAYSTIHFYRKKGIKLDLRYQDDVMERGGVGFQKDLFSLTGTAMYRNFFIQYMDHQRLAEAVFSANIKSNIKVSVGGNFQRVWFNSEYQFKQLDDNNQSFTISQTDVAEANLEFIWNIRERVMQIGDQRISKGTKYPKIRFKIAKSLTGFYTAQFDYTRLNLDIQQDFPILALGKFAWCLSGGQTIGDVPLFLQQVGNGTGRQWNLSVKNTFETMVPGEFYHTRQAGLFTRMEFTKFQTKAKWNEPQIVLHHAIGYGEMNLKSSHNVGFRSMDKGFFEGGLILNNVLVSGVSGIGIGAFYRYGAYSSTDAMKNLYLKLSLSFNM